MFNSDWIFYIGSFSKILAPSLRVGWLVVPEFLHKPLSILKEGTDINIATYTQRLVSKILDSISIENHIEALKISYKQKREVMFEASEKHFPKEMVIKKPRSGLFFWVKLPSWINVKELYDLCIKKYKVAFIPGDFFEINKKNKTENAIRLNFSYPTGEQITEGIYRISQAIHELKEYNGPQKLDH